MFRSQSVTANRIQIMLCEVHSNMLLSCQAAKHTTSAKLKPCCIFQFAIFKRVHRSSDSIMAPRYMYSFEAKLFLLFLGPWVLC